MKKIIQSGNRAVVILQNPDGGKFRARLYVNFSDDITCADATSQTWSGNTLAGAEKWASKILQSPGLRYQRKFGAAI